MPRLARTTAADKQDLATILGHRHDNGDDHWATADGKLYVDSPWSTIGALGLLHELDVPASHEAVAGALERVEAAVRDDGRIRLGPKTPLYPCYTAEALRMLCRFGRAGSPAVAAVIEHLLDTGHDTGGWRCSFSRFGKGPETAFANPGATLFVLDALRFVPELRAGHAVVDAAVESLLSHWETRAPLGPCHYGIGSTFLRLEYPFVRYNLFLWTEVLSHFERARGDDRFAAAVAELEAQLDDEGRLIVRRPHRGLGGLHLCTKDQPSRRGSARVTALRTRLAADAP